MTRPRTYPIVVCDVDQVLLDFDDAWRNCAVEVLCRPLAKVCDTWDMSTRYGLSKELVRQVWDCFHRDGWWGRIEPYPYAFELIHALRDMGCDIWAVTNVDPQFRQERALTLGGLVPEKHILMLGAKASPAIRVKALQDLHALAFLDDSPANVNAAAFVVPACALLHRGYTDVPPPGDGVTVIDDALDFPQLLESMLP